MCMTVACMTVAALNPGRGAVRDYGPLRLEFADSRD